MEKNFEDVHKGRVKAIRCAKGWPERATVAERQYEALMEEYRQLQSLLPTWYPISPRGNHTNIGAVWLYGPELVDEDFNPEGVVEGYFCEVEPEGEWIGAVWNGEQDVWMTQTVHPTHYMPKIQGPKE